MKCFSEKALQSLGDFYVYGLIDPRTKKIFYIGKGTGNRVFDHEKEQLNSTESDKLKLKTISEIHSLGLDVEKIIIHSNLSENEAFKTEAALINAFNYVGETELTNIVSGHHSDEALTVENFEKKYGAKKLSESEIKHKILVIKINKRFRWNMSDKDKYEAVRGVWRASLEKVRSVDYVFAVYNSLIVAVYKPTKWYRCTEAQEKRPRQNEILTPQTENRVFFVDDSFEKGYTCDENQTFYKDKSIAELKLNHSAQNPITYIFPQKTDQDIISKSKLKKINKFATKWLEKFCDRNTNYIELVDGFMGDDCKALGFEMDCGAAFSEKYNKAFDETNELEKIINEVTDIFLLGSAVFSKWRYFNHWSYCGSEIWEPQNREWFIIALSRLRHLSTKAK